MSCSWVAAELQLFSAVAKLFLFDSPSLKLFWLPSKSIVFKSFCKMRLEAAARLLEVAGRLGRLLGRLLEAVGDASQGFWRLLEADVLGTSGVAFGGFRKLFGLFLRNQFRTI